MQSGQTYFQDARDMEMYGNNTNTTEMVNNTNDDYGSDDFYNYYYSSSSSSSGTGGMDVGDYFIIIGLFACICFLSCFKNGTSRGRQQREMNSSNSENQPTKSLSKQEKQTRLEQLFEISGNHMTLTEELIQSSQTTSGSGTISHIDEKKKENGQNSTTTSSDDDTIASETDEEMGMVSGSFFLSITTTPPPSTATAAGGDVGNNKKATVTTSNEQKQQKEEGGMSVPNCCAICLQYYKAGEQIVWSASLKEGCSHVYHRTCMIDYLVRYKGGDGSPCPTCRRNFVDDSLLDASSSSQKENV